MPLNFALFLKAPIQDNFEALDIFGKPRLYVQPSRGPVNQALNWMLFIDSQIYIHCFICLVFL